MKKNFSLLFIANITKGFYQWCLLILIIKFLSVEDVGVFTLAFAVTAPIFMFFNLQLKSIYVVDFRRVNYDFNYYIIRILSLLIGLIFLSIYSYFNNYDLLILMLVGIIKSIESISDIIHADYQKKEMMHFMSISIMIQSLGSLIVFSIVLFFSKSLHISLISIIFILLIVLVFYDFRIFKKLNNLSNRYILFIKEVFFKNNNINFIKKLLLNSLPLGFSVLIVSYLTNMPRIYVEKYIGLEELAYFGAMSYMSIGFFQLLLPLQTIIRPKLAKLLNEGKNIQFNKYLVISIFITILFGISLFIVFYFFGSIILLYIYNKSYVDYLDILLILLFSQTILTISVFLNIAVQTYHVFKLQVFISLISLVILFVISELLIKEYQVKGASYMVFINAIISVICYYVLFNYKKQKKF